ncbi:2-polyprenyl-6-methoxyphenol hydroxylase-like FAD-dependent oxidoreductase [Bradyrhizobium sp. GM24.11]
MQTHSTNLYDVVIAGASPVGLFLACELRLAGVSVLVLEQAHDPHSALKQLPFGLRGLSVPTTEAFHRRGLLDEIVAAQRAKSGAIRSAAHWMQQTRRPAGHFAGIQFYQDDVDAAKWSWRLPTPADLSVAVDMQTLESVLTARASSLGVEIRRGFGVNAIAVSEDDVTVQAAGETFSRTLACRLRWRPQHRA